MDLLSKTKVIKDDILNAKSHLASATELLNQYLKVNDVLIEKILIDELNGNMDKMLDVVDNKLISNCLGESVCLGVINTMSNSSSNSISNSISN